MGIGLVALVCGLTVFAAGVLTLGSSLSPFPAPMASAELVDHGIYRFIRHPIYTGLILAAAGGSIYAVSPVALGLTVALAVVLDLKSRREEAWLSARFPGYVLYAARTKRFVPGIY
jgi:protein-S-isoprenylcysteine O-methyltransferase Ste14